MEDETKILNKLLEYFKESNINDFGYEKDKLISYEEAQILLDYITNLQEDYDKAMKLVDKGVEDSYIKIKEQQKEVDKLTAESTEWESKCYDLQEENERLKERCEYLQRSCDRKEEQMLDYRMEYMGQEDYKARNEKAIEYIKEQTKGYQDDFDRVDEESWLYDLKIALNILQGEDNK